MSQRSLGELEPLSDQLPVPKKCCHPDKGTVSCRSSPTNNTRIGFVQAILLETAVGSIQWNFRRLDCVDEVRIAKIFPGDQLNVSSE